MLKLEKIEYPKKGKVKLSFDSGDEFVCNQDLLLRYSLRLGQEFSEADVEDFMAMMNFQECHDVAVRALERRLHSRNELKRKLFQKQKFTKNLIEIVLNDLEESAYLNDRLFAELFVQDRNAGSRAIGSGKLRAQLYQKGLDREIIDEVLREVHCDDDVFDKAYKEAERRWQRDKTDDHYKKKQKIYRFLAGRGFSGAIINRIFQKIEQEHRE